MDCSLEDKWCIPRCRRKRIFFCRKCSLTPSTPGVCCLLLATLLQLSGITAFILVLILLIFQFLAFIWYSVTYIPVSQPLGWLLGCGG